VLNGAIDDVHCWFGEWVTGRNAGGSISYPTLHQNPQFAFDVAAGLWSAVGGVAQWLERRSLAGGLSLIYA